MATYQVDTDGGSYQVETEDTTPMDPNKVGGPQGSFPEPQVSDNPPAGAEKPVEQRLAENAMIVGSGAGLASGLGELGEAGAGALGLTKNAVSNAGAMGTAGQYAKRFAQNQAMKTLGARGGQIGQVGIPESREIAQKLLDTGTVSPFRGPIGLEEKVGELQNTAGQGVGNARALGNQMGQAPTMSEILQQVDQNLTGKYGSGVNKGMAGLNRAKEEVAKGGTGDFVGNAQKATDLNASAAANKLYRPTGADTDVADVISHLNNSKLAETLSPEQMAQYNKDLKDYADFSKVKEFLKSGERREMSGRGGSATVGKALADQTMDMMGNRVAATGLNNIGNVLQSEPIQKSVNPLAAYLSQKDKDENEAQ